MVKAKLFEVGAQHGTLSTTTLVPKNGLKKNSW